MAKAVFFDLWNTLLYCPTRERVDDMIDALGLSRRVDYNQVIEELGSTVFVDCDLDVKEMLRDLCGKHGVTPSESQVSQASTIWESRLSEAELFPDVKPALKELDKGYRLGLISNTDKSGADFLKAKRLFGDFDVVVMSCFRGYAKPAAAIFEAAVKEIGALPDECWMVGDNVRSDVEGARAAGLNAILIDRSGKHKGGEGYHVIRSLTEVREVIE